MAYSIPPFEGTDSQNPGNPDGAEMPIIPDL